MQNKLLKTSFGILNICHNYLCSIGMHITSPSVYFASRFEVSIIIG